MNFVLVYADCQYIFVRLVSEISNICMSNFVFRSCRSTLFVYFLLLHCYFCIFLDTSDVDFLDFVSTKGSDARFGFFLRGGRRKGGFFGFLQENRLSLI